MRLMEEAKNDAELVLLFQQGQEWAFEELFQRYKQAAMRSAFLLTGNYFDAENVLQEAFIKCYQKLAGLRKPECFKAWFWRILTHTAWAYCKKRDRETPIAAIFEEYSAGLPNEGRSKSALEYLTENEEQQILQAAIKRLPLKQKTVIVLYYYNEMSVQEIAQATGSLCGTVKSRLFTARRNLAVFLQEREADKNEKEQNVGLREFGKRN